MYYKIIYIIYFIALIIYRFRLLSELYYLLLIVLILSYLAKNNYKLYKDFKLYKLAKIIFIIFTLSFPVYHLNSGYISQYIKEIIFVILPLLFVLVVDYKNKFTRSNKTIKTLFYIHISVYVLELIYFGRVGLDLIGINSLMNPEFSSESGLAFIFGLFFLYFFTTKKLENRYLFLIVSILLVLFSGKRIVILALVASLTYYYIYNINNVNILPYVMVFVNLIFVYILVEFTKGSYDQLFSNYLNISANEFTMGRRVLYDNYFKNSNISLWPSGIGTSSVFLENQGYQLKNLHSDVIRLASEIGLIMFSILIFSYYYIYRHNRKAISFIVYFNVLLLTDNVFIYVYFLIILYLLLNKLTLSNSRKKISINSI